MIVSQEFGQIHMRDLAESIKTWGKQLGFQRLGIAKPELGQAESHLQAWLFNGFHGDMDYMARHGGKRSRPAELVPGTMRIISARMDYLPESRDELRSRLDNLDTAYISRYALGRDYHKLLRRRLQGLAERIRQEVGPFGYRVFADSAPVLEKPLAVQAGLGWIGKHTNLIDREAGSFFFLAEIYTDLPLPEDASVSSHCGSCTACLEICPTRAIVAPYHLDARRCISYLTIELRGPIPVEFRRAMGNRIYGCDDCQLVCPWNRYAKRTKEAGFLPRHGLDTLSLIDAFGWDEAEFLRKTEGSAIRRIGHERWLRNVAIGLGNARKNVKARVALESRSDHPSTLVREHVQWALEQQGKAITETAGLYPGVSV